VNTSSLKYLWNTSTTAPTEASFTSTFTNGGTLTSPAGVTGGYYLWILAKDTAGNTLIARTNVFNIDNTVPTTPTVNLNGYTSGSWTGGNVTVTSSSVDGNSGLQKYQASADNGANWGDISSNWIINTDYVANIIIRAIDNAGNISASSSSYTIRRDATPPTTPTVNLNGYTSGSWTKGNVTQTFSSSDATSGISIYQYSTDGGANWYGCPNPWVINWDGQWQFNIRSIDNTGNGSGASSAYIVRRDATIPVITMNGNSSVTIDKGTTYTDAGATATDNLSGISGSIAVSSNVNPNVVGTYYVTYNVSDNAANPAVSLTRTVVVQQSYSCPSGGTLTYNAGYGGYICTGGNGTSAVIYDSCYSSSCNYCTYTYQTYGSSSSCGYATCQSSSCGYASCPDSSCGCYSYTPWTVNYTTHDPSCDQQYPDNEYKMTTCESRPGQDYYITVYTRSCATYYSCTSSSCGYASCSTSSCGYASCYYDVSTSDYNCSACGSTCNSLYYCASGWSTYSGSGSGLVCYRAATAN
jgi:hypothetical protein